MSADLFKAELLEALPSVRAFALSISGNRDQADDLVQEAMVRAWANRDRYATGSNMRAWLFTILRNAHFSNIRKHKREVEDPEGRFAKRLAGPPEQDSHLAFADLASAFKLLSDDQREALVLVAAEGFSYEETAEITGCAIGTIKSRVNRGRARLAELLNFDPAEELGPDRTTQSIVGRAVASSG